LSHLAETLFRYGENQVAYDLLMRLKDSSRREYPEVSYSTVAAVINGLMGIELEIHPPEQALTMGYYVDRYVTTYPRLTSRTAWASVAGLPIRTNRVSVRHEGQTLTTLTNDSGPSFLWKAKLPGSFAELLVDGEPMEATQERLFAVDQQISWVTLIVGPGEAFTVAVPD